MSKLEKRIEALEQEVASLKASGRSTTVSVSISHIPITCTIAGVQVTRRTGILAEQAWERHSPPLTDAEVRAFNHKHGRYPTVCASTVEAKRTLYWLAQAGYYKFDRQEWFYRKLKTIP
jgi:uncharacterized protein YceH (UPF0502 family)